MKKIKKRIVLILRIFLMFSVFFYMGTDSLYSQSVIELDEVVVGPCNPENDFYVYCDCHPEDAYCYEDTLDCNDERSVKHPCPEKEEEGCTGETDDCTDCDTDDSGCAGGGGGAGSTSPIDPVNNECGDGIVDVGCGCGIAKVDGKCPEKSDDTDCDKAKAVTLEVKENMDKIVLYATKENIRFNLVNKETGEETEKDILSEENGRDTGVDYDPSDFAGSTMDYMNHSHFVGAEVTFSVDDIFTLNTLYEAGLMSDPSTFKYGVKNEFGTEYVTQISDVSLFATMPSDLDSVRHEYNKIDASIFVEYKALGHTPTLEDASLRHELAVIKLLEQFGAVVYKKEKGEVDFKKQDIESGEKDEDGNLIKGSTVTNTDCDE